MTHHMRLIIGGLLMTLIIVFPINSRAQSVNTNFLGINGPFRFKNYCMPNKNEVWSVGGLGQVLYQKRDDYTVEYRLLPEDSYESFYGVYFNNDGAGWVVGDKGLIFHTPDKGRTWTQQFSGVKITLSAITCVDEKTCWAVGDEGTILRTSDKGETWKVIEAHVSDDLEAIDFIDSKTGWIVGDNGLILKTEDGGKTWTSKSVKLNTDGGTPVGLRAVKFMTEKLGWVAGWDGIARTSDGGRTWEITNIGDAAFVGLVSHNSNKVLAVNKGDNYCSEDTGKTWKKCFLENAGK